MTTFYGTDENSNLRIYLFERSLENAKRLGNTVVIFDGGSNHPNFARIIQKYREIVDIQYGEFNGLGDQTRKMLNYINDKYRDRYIFRTEPEKYGLLTKENLGVIVQKAKLSPNALYVSPTRNIEISRLPRSLAIVEASVGGQVNTLMKLQNEINFKAIHDGSVSEGPGSLFGPILITQKGVDAIVSSNNETWGTWFLPRIVAAMEGKSLYIPVGYNYDEQEIKKENADMRKLWKFCIIVIILDIVRLNLKEGNVQGAIEAIESSSGIREFDLKNNLAFKRLQQFVIMFNLLSTAIFSKK